MYADGRVIDVPVVPASALVDQPVAATPSAGLLYGIAHGWSVERRCRLGSLVGSIKISERGGQNHSFTRAAIRARFSEAWGERLVTPPASTQRRAPILPRR